MDTNEREEKDKPQIYADRLSRSPCV